VQFDGEELMLDEEDVSALANMVEQGEVEEERFNVLTTAGEPLVVSVRDGRRFKCCLVLDRLPDQGVTGMVRLKELTELAEGTGVFRLGAQAELEVEHYHVLNGMVAEVGESEGGRRAVRTYRLPAAMMMAAARSLLNRTPADDRAAAVIWKQQYGANKRKRDEK
jgi:hypothetical protein